MAVNATERANTPEATAAVTQPTAVLARLLNNKWLHCACIVAVIFVCFARTLGSYFLADDFGEVAYVHRIFAGEWELLWSNFTGNYMQIPGMAVWRPWLLVSLVCDYALWHASAAGYYLTNLLFYSACAVLVYFAVDMLASDWSRARRSLAALLAACLFAVSPLHCESVSWVVGRVDIISCFFYLLGFVCALNGWRQSRKSLTIASVACFWLGMGTKEMAIGLPVLFAFAVFLWSDNGPVLRRLGTALKAARPLILSMLIYFPLRYLCLGTLVGGYTAGFGASQMAAMFHRWTDPDTVSRLLIPLHHQLFPQGSIFQKVLALAYVALFVIALARALMGAWAPRWLALLAVWLATAAAPIFQLWGIGYNLEGSRFYFFLTVPLCILASVIILGPPPTLPPQARRAHLVLESMGVCVLLVIFLALGKACYATNLLWVHAGKEVRAFTSALVNLAHDHSGGKKIAVLGIPKDRGGAHLILNGETLAVALSPPFTPKNVADRFLTFDPIMFGPPELINGSRFQSVMLSQHAKGPFLWMASENRLAPVTIKPAAKDAPIIAPDLASIDWRGIQPHAFGHARYDASSEAVSASDVVSGDGLLVACPASPYDIAFAEMDLKYVNPHERPAVSMTWEAEHSNAAAQGDDAATAPVDNGRNSFQTVRLRLSHYWRWYAAGQIRSANVRFTASDRVEMRNLRFLPYRLVAPTVTLASGSMDNTGVHKFATGAVKIHLSPPETPSAAAYEVEVTRPNFFFDNQASADLKTILQATIKVPSLSATVDLSPHLFTSPGYYEVRARCLDARGAQVGELSDQITLLKGN